MKMYYLHNKVRLMAVITVLGDIDQEAVGIALPHEHFFYDLRWACKEPWDPVEKALLIPRLDCRMSAC